MVVEHFSGDHDRALREMDSHPKSLFLYLKTIMEAHTKGSLNFSCFRKGDNVNIPTGRRNSSQPNRIEAYLEKISELPKLMRDNPVHVTDKIVEQYLEVKFSLTVFSRWCMLYLKVIQMLHMHFCIMSATLERGNLYLFLDGGWSFLLTVSNFFY